MAINGTLDGTTRCGSGCDSSTTTPSIVYFPAGTYLITSPLLMFYYTQLIGDATNLPVIKGAASFYGIALLDADQYYPGGANWYTNQNNFYRQVRNFVIDMTAMDPTTGYGAGIHWQVAQATSLQNIVFNMVVGGKDNKQQGIFMDNGSANFFGDLIFNGGDICMFMGNQVGFLSSFPLFFCSPVHLHSCAASCYRSLLHSKITTSITKPIKENSS